MDDMTKMNDAAKTTEQPLTKNYRQMEGENNRRECMPREEARSSEYPFFYFVSTSLTLILLGLLSLFGIIAIHPAWFCVPILLQSGYANFRLMRKAIIAIKYNVSIPDLYKKEQENNDKTEEG